MSAWRVIITDTESASGVAPVCPANHIATDGVYDCCPGPHIECWDENLADEVATRFTEHGVEVCS